MKLNFLCTIDNIYASSDENDNIILENQVFTEVSSDRIEDQKIPSSASAIILFKNEARMIDGKAVIEEFNPSQIQQFVITTEPFLRLPELYARYSLPKDLMDGYVGAYILRDGTLFIMTDELKKSYTPILASLLDKDGNFLKTNLGFSK